MEQYQTVLRQARPLFNCNLLVDVSLLSPRRLAALEEGYRRALATGPGAAPWQFTLVGP